jgi:hypothetical protein
MPPVHHPRLRCSLRSRATTLVVPLERIMDRTNLHSTPSLITSLFLKFGLEVQCDSRLKFDAYCTRLLYIIFYYKCITLPVRLHVILQSKVDSRLKIVVIQKKLYSLVLGNYSREEWSLKKKSKCR